MQGAGARYLQGVAGRYKAAAPSQVLGLTPRMLRSARLCHAGGARAGALHRPARVRVRLPAGAGLGRRSANKKACPRGLLRGCGAACVRAAVWARCSEAAGRADVGGASPVLRSRGARGGLRGHPRGLVLRPTRPRMRIHPHLRGFRRAKNGMSIIHHLEVGLRPPLESARRSPGDPRDSPGIPWDPAGGLRGGQKSLFPEAAGWFLTVLLVLDDDAHPAGAAAQRMQEALPVPGDRRPLRPCTRYVEPRRVVRQV